MQDSSTWMCDFCGTYNTYVDSSDGFFYCHSCNSQAEGIVETGIADEEFIERGTYHGSHHRRCVLPTPQIAIKPEPVSTIGSNSASQFWQQLKQEDDKTPQPYTSHRHYSSVKSEPLEFTPLDGVEATSPTDFAGSGLVDNITPEDYYNETRNRYLMGLQLMIEFQCEALVKEFNVSPLICGIFGSIWLRFVAESGVYDEDYAHKTFFESEMQHQEGRDDYTPRTHSGEPRNQYGKRAVMIWYRSLRKQIPLYSSLAISFLACHVAREAILPTDIVKWTIEGKLPYFSAFTKIEEIMAPSSLLCPLSSSFMFRPSEALALQKLESYAASIAHSIGLELPPVNFYALAFRYLKKLSLPVEKILPHACRVYEWTLPPELWLSASDLRLPTRMFVLAIVIVAIRILYDINGFGEWERSLSLYGGASSESNDNSMKKAHAGEDYSFISCNGQESGTNSQTKSCQDQKSELDAAELLRKLEARYSVVVDAYEYSKDLSTYLQYCKDVVFAGLESEGEEKEFIDYLWQFHQKEEDFEPRETIGQVGLGFKEKRFCDGDEERDGNISEEENGKILTPGESSSMDGICLADDCQQDLHGDHSSQDLVDDREDLKYYDHHSLRDSQDDQEDPNSDDHTSAETHRKELISKLKLDMEQNRFYYIPPRENIKRHDYLHYARKRDEGALTYVAHADYYILLRACAKVAQVDIRIMHIGVLSLERRLAWLENRIDHCLHLKPPSFSCKFCTDLVPENATAHDGDDILGLSDLSI